MNQICSRCHSPRVEITHHGRKTDGTVGAVAVAAAGAEAGAALGVVGGPIGIALGVVSPVLSSVVSSAALPVARLAQPSAVNWTVSSSTTVVVWPAVTPSASSRPDTPPSRTSPPRAGFRVFGASKMSKPLFIKNEQGLYRLLGFRHEKGASRRLFHSEKWWS
ncbi:MAG: hypothetical protein ACOY9J_11200 [Pseudomonadota bacterium]